MIKVYPDRPVAAMLRVLADVVTTGWTVAWAVLGWLIYKTILGLEVIADGLVSTGNTFNGWIMQFRNAIPGGIPGVTQFLINIADALRRYSGEPLVSAGHQVHDAIIQVAIVLALLVALPPILLVLLPYGAWRWRDMRETGAALAFVRIASMTGRAGQGPAGPAYRGGAAPSLRQLMSARPPPARRTTERRFEGLAGARRERGGAGA